MTIKVSLQEKVFRFMNGHPDVGVRRLYHEFKEENQNILRAYHARWISCNRHLLWLYNHMVGKWEPKKVITQADRAKLRRIEELIRSE